MRFLVALIDGASYFIGRIRGEVERQRIMYRRDQDNIRRRVLTQARQRGQDTRRPWRELRREQEAEWREDN